MAGETRLGGAGSGTAIIATAKSLPLEGYRKIASYAERDGIFVSASAVYRILSAEGPLVSRKVLHDNGTQFVSRPFKRFLKDLKIQQVRTAYRHPETNGRLDRPLPLRNASSLNSPQHSCGAPDTQAPRSQQRSGAAKL